MNPATILCKDRILGDVGCALLRVKNARGITLEAMAEAIGVSREMLSHYIAGEAEMGFTKWIYVNETFPELAEMVDESAAERAARSRQIALDLDQRKGRI